MAWISTDVVGDLGAAPGVDPGAALEEVLGDLPPGVFDDTVVEAVASAAVVPSSS